MILEASTLPDDATPAQVQAARLFVDTLKWTASKLRPAAYGDRIAVATTVRVTGHEAALELLDAPIVDITPNATPGATHDGDDDTQANDISELDDDST